MLSDLMRFTGETTPTRAIHKAIDELIERERRVRTEELIKMAGTIEFDEEWLAQRRREHPGAY
ncbi:MAG: hypothetical protein HY685_03790 [Chloroflexi bacterium]|nr:hypothetical protein [Chloroflexota bacterium]